MVNASTGKTLATVQGRNAAVKKVRAPAGTPHAKAKRATKTEAQAQYDAEFCSPPLARRLVRFSVGSGVNTDANEFVGAVYDSILRHVISAAICAAASDKRQRIKAIDVMRATKLLGHKVYGNIHTEYKPMNMTALLAQRRAYREAKAERQAETAQ